MRQLYYTLQTLIRGRGSNIIKIVSLTLGLFVGVLLFARVAFEMSYDNYGDEPEKLYLTYITWVEDGKEFEAFPYGYGAMAAAFRENFPKEVESATVIREWGEEAFYRGEESFRKEIIFADSCFFATMGLKVLAGNLQEMGTTRNLFVSRSLARQLAGSEEAVIGMVVDYQRKYPMTIRGVFEDIPENASLRYEMVCSFATIFDIMRPDAAGWGYDISYMIPVRFRNPADVPSVEARIPSLLTKYVPDEDNKFSFRHISQLRADNKTVQTMIIILSILGTTILLIASMNYVLISVSSIDRRAKSVGVHKCNGADTLTVFRMFLIETAIILLIALILALILMLNLQGLIADVLGVSLKGLFAPQTLWMPAAMLFVTFLLSAVIPGWMFSSIPVTQVFSRYTERKMSWKRVLLFIQFSGTALVFGFLVVVLLQYQYVMNRQEAFNTDRVVCGYLKIGTLDNARSFLGNLPMVEEYAFAGMRLFQGGTSGESMAKGAGSSFSARIGWIGPDFAPFLGMEIMKGRNIQTDEEVLVNEEYVRQAGWTDDPIGKQLMSAYDTKYGTVVGVIKDFTIRSAYFPKDPLALIGSLSGNVHYMRLKEPFQENLVKLNKELTEHFPTEDVMFSSLRSVFDERYQSVKSFRDGVVMAFAAILLITLMGVLGYTNDEVRRRSKEIAIRKVNGAEAWNILSMLSASMLWIALPAVLTGIVASYFIGEKWLDQFVYQIPQNPWVYAGVGVVMLVVILASVVLKARQIANENPVKSIKSE